MKKNFTEIEEIIESRIAELEKEYDLDHYDIEDIRLEAYWENGWSGKENIRLSCRRSLTMKR